MLGLMNPTTIDESTARRYLQNVDNEIKSEDIFNGVFVRVYEFTKGRLYIECSYPLNNIKDQKWTIYGEKFSYIQVRNVLG